MDINFVCAMGPPGGGRNAITPRLTRHFNYLSFAEMDEVSKKRIFSTILGSWVGKYQAGVGEAVGSSRSPGPVSHTGKSGVAEPLAPPLTQLCYLWPVHEPLWARVSSSKIGDNISAHHPKL